MSIYPFLDKTNITVTMDAKTLDRTIMYYSNTAFFAFCRKWGLGEEDRQRAKDLFLSELAEVLNESY